MPYEIIARGGHVCDLPDPGLFAPGDQIRCTGSIFANGRTRVCSRLYWLDTRFWSKQPYWSDDWSW